MKDAAKKKVAEITLDKARSASNLLSKQGDLLQILEEDREEIAWRAIIHKAPRGLLAFGTRAVTNSLASPDNLACWGKLVSPRCMVCGHTPGNLGHLLSACAKAREQGRYTARHDAIIKYWLTSNTNTNIALYADIDGFRTSGGTIPTSVLVTPQRPDLVIQNNNELTLIELTVSWDTKEGIEAARQRKEVRYAPLLSDLQEAGTKANLITIEIGARGFISKVNKSSITHLAHILKISKIKEFTAMSSRLALSGSRAVYNARNSPEW